MTNYTITTTTGTLTKSGKPYIIYQSGDRFQWERMPENGKQTKKLLDGLFFTVYPRKDRGRVILTEESTGFSCIPADYARPKTTKEALKIAAMIAVEIVNYLYYMEV